MVLPSSQTVYSHYESDLTHKASPTSHHNITLTANLQVRNSSGAGQQEEKRQKIATHRTRMH